MLPLLLAIAIQQPAQPADPFARWEKNIVAIEKRLKADPPKPGSVFFVGSSSIVRWDLEKSFPKSNYVNVGFGGSVIVDSTHFAPRILLPYKPSTIVFYAGDNDIGRGGKAEKVLTDFKEFVATIRKDNPECQVVFLPVKPSIKRWEQFGEQKKANALVQAYCDDTKGLTYIDLVTPMLGDDGKPMPDLFVKDGLHLSPKGYEMWTAAVKKVLK